MKAQNESNKSEKEDNGKLIKEEVDHNKSILEKQSKDRLISNNIKDESFTRDKSKIINKEKARDLKGNIHLNNKNDNISKSQTLTNFNTKKLPETGNSDYSILGALLTLLGFSAVRRKKER